jgi:hypothetical protein
VVVRVDRLSGGCSAEEFGDLGEAFFLGFLGKRKVLAVGLGFPGKRGLQVISGLCHGFLLYE